MAVSEILAQAAAETGLSLPDSLFPKLDQYAGLLREWNEKINLTAVTDDEGIAVKHFLDSLMLLKAPAFTGSGKLIDVGTGAGFPGLVLALAFPALSVTLLDSTGKKLTALQDIASSLGARNVSFVHLRAEEAGQKKEYREQYDFATARAVAKLNVLSEYCLPFVKTGGTFFAYKTASAEELKDAAGALSVLCAEKSDELDFELCGEGKRSILSFKKISQIPTIYPRPSAKISKFPL